MARTTGFRRTDVRNTAVEGFGTGDPSLSVTRALRARLLRIPPESTSFSERGFAQPAPEVRALLERHGGSFVTGFNLGVGAPDLDSLASSLESTPPSERGFSFEGAAMALALLDHIGVRSAGRLEQWAHGPGDRHVYMVYVGAGWALARLRRRPWGRLRDLDPLLRWLVIDGYGFHEGFFHPARSFEGRRRPGRLSGYALRVFDQGLGRSLWFVQGASVERIAACIGAFEEARRADLWSGVGLAATYAGGAAPSDLEDLALCSGPYRSHVAQGSAFAAAARERAGNVVHDTVVACRMLCASTPAEAARMTEEARGGLPRDEDGHAYEQWRGRIRELANSVAGA